MLELQSYESQHHTDKQQSQQQLELLEDALHESQAVQKQITQVRTRYAVSISFVTHLSKLFNQETFPQNNHSLQNT